MIKVENVSFKYKHSNQIVLDNLNFEVNDGEVVAIVGKNGQETKVPITLNEKEQRKLSQSASTLKEILKELDL